MPVRCWCGKPVVFDSGKWWHQLGVGDEVRLWVGRGPDPDPDHEPCPVVPGNDHYDKGVGHESAI